MIELAAIVLNPFALIGILLVGAAINETARDVWKRCQAKRVEGNR